MAADLNAGHPFGNLRLLHVHSQYLLSELSAAKVFVKGLTTHHKTTERLLSSTTMADASQPPCDASGLNRCTDLWFEDCGLIVRAEDTLFRISGAQLAAHSAVFADMRVMRQPEDAEHFTAFRDRVGKAVPCSADICLPP
ncbi:hypothetical protein FB45DRAFT_1117307 [Roridomyces roridus]|uniref:Uncharacterized protein n=1 Tax=Roridomyces roridus TaxID=1738132 RepID=A0AAD7FAT4_9AGAR|nr:hypothetical protein FB45DRAFT_1117307 [Roridomyces roridus]